MALTSLPPRRVSTLCTKRVFSVRALQLQCEQFVASYFVSESLNSLTSIDTGVDYNHPLLGGGIGLEKKVLGGYDLVGDSYNGTNTPVPGPNPMDCNSHGTHVAGIVAASGPNPYNITGVAPQANLRA